MKILHVNEHNALCGGVEGYVSDVIALLQHAGHENRLIYHQAAREAALDSAAEYIPYREAGGNIKSACEKITRLLAREKPDVVFIHAVYHPAIIAAAVAHTPALMYVHSPHAVCPGDAQYWRRSQRVCPRAAGWRCLLYAQVEQCCWGHNPLHHLAGLKRVQDTLHTLHHTLQQVLVGSVYMRDLLIRNGVPAHKLRVLPPFFLNTPENNPHTLPPLNPPLLLFVGRMVPEKGMAHLLQALTRVPGEWQLLMIGDGPNAPTCQQQIATAGLSSRVRLTGWLTAAELQPIYQQASLLVMPALWPEPFGRVGPEIMAWGKPVVAYDVGGIHEWLHHGENGLLVRPGDILGLAAAITQLLTDAACRAQLGARAQQSARQQFAATAHLAALNACFAEAQTQFGARS